MLLIVRVLSRSKKDRLATIAVTKVLVRTERCATFPMIRTFRGVMPRIADSAYIDSSAQIIGDVVIGERTSVWPNVTIRGDVNHIRIGDETSIQDNTVLHVDRLTYPCLDWQSSHRRDIPPCFMAAL